MIMNLKPCKREIKALSNALGNVSGKKCDIIFGKYLSDVVQLL